MTHNHQNSSEFIKKYPKSLKTSKIIKNHSQLSNNDKNRKYPYLILGKVYFPAEKAFAPPQKHLDLNTHQESNLAPLGSQAGDLTTRPDLYGLGDGTILANFDKIIEIWEMVK